MVNSKIRVKAEINISAKAGNNSCRLGRKFLKIYQTCKFILNYMYIEKFYYCSPSYFYFHFNHCFGFFYDFFYILNIK